MSDIISRLAAGRSSGIRSANSNNKGWAIDGTRTRDIQDHNLALYHLSYDRHTARWIGPARGMRQPTVTAACGGRDRGVFIHALKRRAHAPRACLRRATGAPSRKVEWAAPAALRPDPLAAAPTSREDRAGAQPASRRAPARRSIQAPMRASASRSTGSFLQKAKRA